jgi:L-iditol 2-dehydrogenase
MKQQIMIKPGKIEFRDIPIPELKLNEVLVKIFRIGVCGSDIHVFHGVHGTMDLEKHYPVTQGHEVSGVVEKVGSMVKNYQLGDKVTIQPQKTCGTCFPCTHGKYHICDQLLVMGFQTTGMASEYFVADENRLVKLPEDMSYEKGAMIEPMAVACHVLSRGTSVKDSNVIVLGAGTIGNVVGQTAKAYDAKAVLITDISDFRLNIAKKVGLDFMVNPLRQNLSEEIIKAFGPDKADIIIECVGSQSTLDSAVENARKGTDIIIVGVPGEKPLVDIAFVQDRELRLIGSLMYQTKDYINAIELVQSGKISLEPLMTKHFKFEDYAKAYHFIEEKKDEAMKVFIDVDK